MYRVILVCALVVCLTGCINTSLIETVQHHTSVILPEYVKYVQNDASLEDSTKAIRIQSANTLEQLLLEANPVKEK